MGDKSSNKTSLTTIGIDQQTNKLIDKLCKRYSLKKGEIVKLAFAYLDKACINPKEAPESTKTELSKINKRQDDIIRFIRNYEEKELNPMIRATNSIAVRFEKIARGMVEIVNLEIKNSKDMFLNLAKKLDEDINRIINTMNNQSRHIKELIEVEKNKNEIEKNNNKKLLKLISLYSELATCGVMDGKRKESLKAEINNLINGQ